MSGPGGGALAAEIEAGAASPALPRATIAGETSGLGRLSARLSGAIGWRRRGWAFLLGVIAVLALPPLGVLPVLLLSFPGLVWLIDGAGRPRRAAADGWWFGFGYFSAGLYWIAYALLVDPLRHGWLIPFAVFGLGGLLAVFIAAATWAAARFARPGLARVALLASAWMVMEWVRSWILTGFPWNLIGSVWLPVLPVAQFASVAGTYGLSLLTVLVAAMPALLRRPGVRGWAAVGGAFALLAGVAVWGGIRLGQDTVAPVSGVRLRLVQANIEQTLKWNPEMRAEHFRRHMELSLSPGWTMATHVIWPETAAPSFLERDPLALRLMAQAVPPHGLLMTGGVRGTPPGVDPFQAWNSLVAVNGRGEIVATYDKSHLVPFGEYMPLHSLLPLGKITNGAVDFSSGPGPVSLDLPGLPTVGPQICYEVIFPAEVVDEKHRPAWMLNVTNDGWYGVSAGPYQHLAAARLRAIEEGLPLARAANTGISAMIDAYGRVTGELALGTAGVLDADLPAAIPEAPTYARFGNSVPLILASIIAIFSVFLPLSAREG
ncbi:MAG: apolipoprotein N-acyltransferase [Telmatospirillum sp.]|nr:apolipoprotein N-acyltransferase [Telmatospirillum sp.]